ncbi:MAG: hypothetical protein HYY84_03145 [Deltaproteobacteria bacterium]|nr:hypothetical protein [Deltaproteobacteria bacterium]
MNAARRIACLLGESPAAQGATSACALMSDVAHGFSPRVEVCEVDSCVFVDITGLQRLFESEEQIVRAIRHVVEKMGIVMRVGVGGGKAIAHIFAEGEKRNHRGTESGRSEERSDFENRTSPQTSLSLRLCGFSLSSEKERLAGLPIRLLRPSDDVAKVLCQWGLRTIGDLARLPRKEIEARLGREGILLHRLACAEDDAPLVPTPAPETFREVVDFDFGLSNLEPLAFVMRGMLDRLAERLECRGLAASDVRVVLTLADRRRHERTLSLAAPTRDAKTLLDLIRLDLVEHPPDAEIEAIAIDLIARPPRPAQLGLFEPKGPSPDRLATTLARLSAIVGRERFGAPALVDSHRPEAFALVPFGEERRNHARDPSSRLCQTCGHRDKSVLVSRQCRAGTELQRSDEKIYLGNVSSLPNSLSLRLCGFSSSLSSVLRRERTTQAIAIDALRARIADLRGPFRLVGEWWAATSFARDYYDATLCDGSVIRLYRDIVANTWVIDGLIH